MQNGFGTNNEILNNVYDNLKNAIRVSLSGSTESTLAENGVHLDGVIVKLGGDLIEETEILFSGYTFILNDNNGLGIQYSDNYSDTFVNRSLIDKEYAVELSNMYFTSGSTGENSLISIGNKETDGDAIGESSLGIGYGTQASGDYSFASGMENESSGIGSSTFGGVNDYKGVATPYPNSAENYSAIAEGINSVASGVASHAGGNGAEASGNYSLSFGLDSISSGYNSIAFGSNTESTSNHSFAGGTSSKATGGNSFAYGYEVEANGLDSVAFNYRNIADGDYSFVFGLHNQALSYGALVGGYYAVVDANMGINISRYANDNTTRGVFGDQSLILGGYNNHITGENSGIISGSDNEVSHNNSFVIGGDTLISDNDNTLYVNTLKTTGNRKAIITITSDLTIDQFDDVIRTDSSNSAITMYLPSIDLATDGQIYTIKTKDITNETKIVCDDTDTFDDGSNSYIFVSINEIVKIIADNEAKQWVRID